MFDVIRMPIIAKQIANKRRYSARLAELLAEPKPDGYIPTLSLVGPCEPIDRSGHVDGANLRTLAPWPGLKPLARAAVGQ